MLRAPEFLSAVQERNALCKQHHGDHHFLSAAADPSFLAAAAFPHLVPGCVIVMTFHIIDDIARIDEHPSCAEIDAAGAQTVLHDIDELRIAGAIPFCRDLIRRSAALHHIAETVRKMCDKRHAAIVLHAGPLLFRHERRHVPPFSIYHEIRIDRTAAQVDLVDRGDVQDAHQVEAQAVDVIEPRHPYTSVHEIAGAHAPRRVDVIAAPGTIGKIALIIHQEIIVGNDVFQ